MSRRRKLTIAERERIVADHAGLVRAGAKRLIAHLPPSFELDDLISEGYVAMLEQLDRWDPRRGVTFGSFVRMRVWGAMVSSIRRRHYKNATMLALVFEESGHGSPANGSRGHREPLDPIGEREMTAAIEREQRLAAIDAAAEKLTPAERYVFQRHYCEGTPIRAIGAEIHRSESRVSQIHAEAIAEVKHRCRARVRAL